MAFRYTEAMHAFLVAGFSQHNCQELTTRFNTHFGVQKNPVQVAAYLKRHRIKSGRTGQFKKGHIPANKGQKGPAAHGKQALTVFKKGQVPLNKKPIGHERIDKQNGYVYIKTDQVNPYTGAFGWYRQKHIVTWEAHHGPVPPGHCVLIKDGNKHNVSDIDNLMLVTRAQLVQLNKTGLIHMPAPLKEAAVATVELTHRLRTLEQTQLSADDKEAH